MLENTKENDELIKQKLNYIGLDLEDIPQSLLSVEKIKYKPIKSYEDNNYKAYKYVDVADIEILITPEDRLDDLNEKLKKALPLANYLEHEGEEKTKENNKFLNLLDNLDLEKLQEIEEEQKTFMDKVPYKVKYRNNYIWQIYYSDIDNKYFMLFSSNETHSEALFYLIKQKLKNSLKKIYVPISHLEYSNKILKKSEIADLENYLWFFTKEWPNIYEVYDQKNESTIQILGKTKVYEDVKSLYKISLNNKEEAQEIFKLIKALFILQSNEEYEYDFQTVINNKGGIDFYYNSKKVDYENLPEFIKEEVKIKQETAENINIENTILFKQLEKLKNDVNNKKEEYLLREKQITNFLECKKTFFGRVKYYFSKGKKIKKQNIEEKLKDNKSNKEDKTDKVDKELQNAENLDNPDKKDIYTLEDLIKVCEILKTEELKYKDMKMDYKALENKKENLSKKIENAQLYIKEIESHKKSIFEFWKFTNKDNSNLLLEGQEENVENKKLKKVFNFEEDIEDFGKKIDAKQRQVFTKNECDAIFAIRNDINTFNILNKDRLLKKDETQIEKMVKTFKKEYMDNIDVIEEKAFDIFGNVSEDKTKIKTLNNNKHREIEKDKYKILNISPDVTVEEYKENIAHYKTLLEEAYGKMTSPYELCFYLSTSEKLNEHSFEIFDLNIKKEIQKNKDFKKLNLYKINIKENMPVIFYSNIMFFDNLNKTLPEGMDVETKALIDLKKFGLKLVSNNEFTVNFAKNEFENKVQIFEVFEYNVEIKNNT